MKNFSIKTRNVSQCDKCHQLIEARGQGYSDPMTVHDTLEDTIIGHLQGVEHVICDVIVSYAYNVTHLMV